MYCQALVTRSTPQKAPEASSHTLTNTNALTLLLSQVKAIVRAYRSPDSTCIRVLVHIVLR